MEGVKLRGKNPTVNKKGENDQRAAFSRHLSLFLFDSFHTKHLKKISFLFLFNSLFWLERRKIDFSISFFFSSDGSVCINCRNYNAERA